jgi:hypothetical protein
MKGNWGEFFDALHGVNFVGSHSCLAEALTQERNVGIDLPQCFFQARQLESLKACAID